MKLFGGDMMNGDPVRPPRFPQWIVNRLLSPYTEISLPGDLEEEFELIRRESGRQRARLWYRLQATKSLPFLIKNLAY